MEDSQKRESDQNLGLSLFMAVTIGGSPTLALAHALHKMPSSELDVNRLESLIRLQSVAKSNPSTILAERQSTIFGKKLTT